jgi:endonuclease/exonuclease/phosphatase family metal-dependent hydrolase
MSSDFKLRAVGLFAGIDRTRPVTRACPPKPQVLRGLSEGGWGWKYFRNAFARDAGLRIDHLLLSPSLAGRLVAAGVDRDVRARERSSDHAPVWIEIADASVGSRRPAQRRRKDRSG